MGHSPSHGPCDCPIGLTTSASGVRPTWPRPLLVLEWGEFEDRVCAVCGAGPAVLHVSRAITPEDALDALYKLGIASRTEESYYCHAHADAAQVAWTASLAA